MKSVFHSFVLLTLVLGFGAHANDADWAVPTPQKITLSSEDTVFLSHLTRGVPGPENYEVLEGKLPSGLNYECASYLISHGRREHPDLRCIVEGFLFSPRDFDYVSTWALSSKGVLFPTQFDDETPFTRVLCKSNGAVNLEGKCEFVHKELNPKAILVKGASRDLVRSALNTLLPKLAAYKVASDELCLQTTDHSGLQEVANDLRDLKVSRDEVVFTSSCTDLEQEGSRTLEVSVTGRGPSVDQEDVLRAYKTLGNSAAFIQKYLLLGHGTEGGNYFCISYDGSLGSDEFNGLIKDLNEMPVDRSRSAVKVKEVSICQPKGKYFEPFIVGRRDIEKEKSLAPTFLEIKKERQQKIRELEEQIEKLQRVAFELFKATAGVIPTDDTVLVARPRVMLRDGLLNVSADYQLASGGVCMHG